MRFDRRTVLGFAAGAAIWPAFAHDTAPTRAAPARGTVETLSSAAFRTQPGFRTRVWMPPKIALAPGKLRTLYLLDGQYAFASDSDAMNFAVDERVARLAAAGTIGPTLVGALDNLEDRRFLQYMPQAIYDRAPAAVRAVADRDMARVGARALVSAALIRFLEDELKPYIDRRYGSSPDRLDTAIFGASQAGVMAGAIFVEAQRSFGRGACMSPNWAIYDKHMIDVPGLPQVWSDFFAQLGEPQGRRLWLDHGTQMMDAGMRPHQAAIADRLVSQGWQRGCNLQTRVYEAGHAFAQTATQMDEVLAWLLA